MFGVRLLNGQVLFVDGVASEVTDPTQETPTEPWKLVGAVFDVVAAELVDRIENVDRIEKIIEADFVFVNNFLFHDMFGRGANYIKKEASMVTLHPCYVDAKLVRGW